VPQAGINIISLIDQPCPQCRGDGEVASGEVDEDGDELPPVGCPRCGGCGWLCLGLNRPGYARSLSTGEKVKR